VWVDSATAIDNVSRVAEKSGLHVSVQQHGEEYHLTLCK